MFEPTHWDDEVGYRRYGALRAEFHNMSAFRYNNVHLGMLGVLYVTAEQMPNQKNQMPCDGPIDSQFVYSRDGITWSHADRERTEAIRRGEASAFDCGMIIGPSKEPVFEGDEMHWYYTSAKTTHGEPELAKRVMKIGRATWKRDRFVALFAVREGEITTKPLLVPEGARSIEINADAVGGRITVELCTPEGNVMSGFSRKECAVLSDDQSQWSVTWQADNISKITSSIKIRFSLENARIFSYMFSGERRG